MSTSKPTAPIDFGFDPTDSQHHFVLYLPRSKKQEVMLFELPNYVEDLTPEGLVENFIGQQPLGKARLTANKWSKLQAAVRAEFGVRLRDWGQRKRPNWQAGINRLHRHLGRELAVLVWSVEEVGGSHIDLAIHNWLALRPEERWWLYTMTNASVGHPERGKGRGWRRALRYALAESPASEAKVETVVDEAAGVGMLFEPGAEEGNVM